jgi:hypothetical protein
MRALILFVILLLWATDLPAQHPVLAEGQRVRISVCLEVARDRVRCSGRIAGTMVEETAGNLIIRHQQDSGIYAIPLNSIQRLQVPKGRKRRTVTSAVVGSVFGAVLGGVIGKRIDPGEPPSPSRGNCINAHMWIICTGDRGEASGLAKGALVGAALGIGVGALTGTFIRTDRWEDIPRGQLRVEPIVGVEGRFGLSASVRF